MKESFSSKINLPEYKEAKTIVERIEELRIRGEEILKIFDEIKKLPNSERFEVYEEQSKNWRKNFNQKEELENELPKEIYEEFKELEGTVNFYVKRIKNMDLSLESKTKDAMEQGGFNNSEDAEEFIKKYEKMKRRGEIYPNTLEITNRRNRNTDESFAFYAERCKPDDWIYFETSIYDEPEKRQKIYDNLAYLDLDLRNVFSLKDIQNIVLEIERTSLSNSLTVNYDEFSRIIDTENFIEALKDAEKSNTPLQEATREYLANKDLSDASQWFFN